MSVNIKENVEQVGALEFCFNPTSTINYIEINSNEICDGNIEISVFDGDIIISLDNRTVMFAINELRFMADCAEKLQKARYKGGDTR